MNMLRSAIPGFLGTFTSRHSDFDGFWLFGLVVRAGLDEDLDLMRPIGESVTPYDKMVALARLKFREQLGKHRIPSTEITTASLRVFTTGDTRDVFVGPQGVTRVGKEMVFRAQVLCADGRTFERERRIYVAPHDAAVESRSGCRAAPSPQ